MIEVTYTRYHLVERCNYRLIDDHEKTFTEKTQTGLFPDATTALHHIAIMNKRCRCIQYAIIDVKQPDKKPPKEE